MSTTVHRSAFSYGKFLAVLWACTVIAIGLTAGRFAIRKRLARFHWDDVTHGGALVTLIIFSSLYTVLFPLSTSLALFANKEGPQPSVSDLKRFYHVLLATEFVFWIVLYLVKFSFLLFYRSIFGISRVFMRFWWAVFAFTFLTFWACFFTVFWTCTTPSQLFVLKVCLSASSKQVTDNYAETCVALNIASDLLIMTLPIWMLRDLKIEFKQKIGLACIFLIALVGIVFDILRIAIGDGGGALSLASLWNVLEPTVAVIVSTLPSYRALLVSPKARSARPSGYKRKIMDQGSYELSGGSTNSQSGATKGGAFSSIRTNPSIRTDPSLDAGKKPVEAAYEV